MTPVRTSTRRRSSLSDSGDARYKTPSRTSRAPALRAAWDTADRSTARTPSVAKTCCMRASLTTFTSGTRARSVANRSWSTRAAPIESALARSSISPTASVSGVVGGRATEGETRATRTANTPVAATANVRMAERRHRAVTAASRHRCAGRAGGISDGAEGVCAGLRGGASARPSFVPGAEMRSCSTSETVVGEGVTSRSSAMRRANSSYARNASVRSPARSRSTTRRRIANSEVGSSRRTSRDRLIASGRLFASAARSESAVAAAMARDLRW